MVMRDRAQRCCSGMEMQCDHNFVDEFRSLRSDYCASDYFAAFGVSDQFNKTFDLAPDYRFSVIFKGVFGDPNFQASFRSFAFTDSHRTELGLGEYSEHFETIIESQ